MGTLLSLALFVIVTTFAGFNIILVFDKEGLFNGLERLGLSYLFGIAAISVEMFFMWVFKMNFVTSHILLPWIALSLLNIARYRSQNIKTWLKKPVVFRFGIFEKLLLFLLSFEVVYTFLRALMKPIESYDSVSIWALKAKVLYLTRMAPSDFFRMMAAAFQGAHADYPLLVPFSQVWFYTFFNGLNDYLVKVIFPLNFLAFLVLFYSALRRMTENRKISLVFTFVLASVKQFNDYATIGSADLQMAAYSFLTFIFLSMWLKYKSRPYLAASIISCAFAFWTKNEGGLILLIMLMVLTGSFLRGEKPFFPIFILFTMFVAWLVFKTNLRLESDIINIGTFKALRVADIYKRIMPIAYEYQKHVFGFKKWNLIWIVFLYFVVIRFKGLFEGYRHIIVPMGGILLVYTAVYMITPQEIHWHLSTTASRLLIHVLPFAVYFVALNINEIYEK